MTSNTTYVSQTHAIIPSTAAFRDTTGPPNRRPTAPSRTRLPNEVP